MKKSGSLIFLVLVLAFTMGLASCNGGEVKPSVTDAASSETSATEESKETSGSKETDEVPEGDMKGWYEIEGKYCFFDRTTGVKAVSAKVNNIEIDDMGFAVMNGYSEEKLPVLVAAREVVDSLREDGISKEDLIMKCYKYVEDSPYLLKDYPITDHMNDYECYDAHYANNLLNAYEDQLKIGGDCTSDAACLAYLFDAAGMTDVIYCHTESHAWVEADGHFWDPLYIETKGMEWYDMTEYPEEPAYKVEI
ncbi:MAG: hypothetical protein J5778_06935 [Clostridiales bacterium]|nr:hypothetical protein [Clostridiales bacterium]